MGQFAYDSVVSEFLWLGIEPKHAIALAGLIYPDEAIKFRNKSEMLTYAEIIMDMSHHKYDEFDVDEITEDSVIKHIKNKGDYKRIAIYIDGSNLLRSYSFIEENSMLVDGAVETEISIDIKNYKTPELTKYYPVWYFYWLIVTVAGFEKALIDKITFVMSCDNKKTKSLLRKIEKDFGFSTVSPPKTGTGLKSSSGEDKYLKDLILSDLKHDNFDIALIGTGDGNKKDGISFPEIGKMIQETGKEVLFAGFDLTTSKAIKKNFDFTDIAVYPLFPRKYGAEIVSLKKSR